MSLVETVIDRLKSRANPANVAGMAHYGINPKNTLGVSMPALRELAKSWRKNHELALELWTSGIHEARILASLVDDPKAVTEQQMDHWTLEFDSWDVCDQVCSNLWEKTPFAYEKAIEWSRRDEEFVKRAGFVLMARLAVSDKKALDEKIAAFLPETERGATDERNFVKKAVNWAVRQIGKRSSRLSLSAIGTAERIALIDSPAARWIAADALRELRSEQVRSRLASRAK